MGIQILSLFINIFLNNYHLVRGVYKEEEKINPSDLIFRYQLSIISVSDEKMLQ